MSSPQKKTKKTTTNNKQTKTNINSVCKRQCLDISHQQSNALHMSIISIISLEYVQQLKLVV